MAERLTSWSFFARRAAGAASVLPAWRLPRGLDVLTAMVPFFVRCDADATTGF
jgi:hypothetical protein